MTNTTTRAALDGKRASYLAARSMLESHLRRQNIRGVFVVAVDPHTRVPARAFLDVSSPATDGRLKPAVDWACVALRLRVAHVERTDYATHYELIEIGQTSHTKPTP